MANVKKGDSQFSDSSDNPMIGSRQSNVADPASTLTASLSAAEAGTLSASKLAAFTIAYGTDDPGTGTDGTINFADGDASLVIAEILLAFEECVAAITTLRTLTDELHDDAATNKTLLAELIVDHATFITDITQNRTAVNAALDVLEAHGLMTES